MLPSNFNVPGLGLLNNALNATTKATLNVKPLSLIRVANMNKMRQMVRPKPGISPQTQREIDREDRSSRELLDTRLARAKGTLKIPEYEKANTQKRFIGVKQDDEKIGIQDLQDSPKIMSNQEIVKKSDAIGAQTQRDIQAGRDFRARQKSEQDNEFASRYGQEALQKAQQAGSEFARQEAKKASDARLRATRGGANLSPEAREIEGMKQRDFERWDRGEIGDVKREGEEGATDKFANVPIRSRTQSILDQSERAEKTAERARQMAKSKLFREGVEYYKDQLNEAVGAKAAEAVRYLTGPGGFVPKIVDPIFDVVKWAARKVGIRGPKTGKAIRRTNQAARAVGRVAPFAAGAGLLYKASGPAAEIAFPSPGGGYGGAGGGIGSPGGRGFSSTAGFAGLGRANASDRRSQKHQEFMGKVAAAKTARDERDVLIKTHMANTGSDRRAAIAELEKNADFNRLTSAGRRFQSGSTTRVVSTGPTSARDESAATKQGRLAQRVGDLAFRPPRNQDEKDRLIRAQQDLDAAYTEAEKQGKMIGYEDQGSLYSGLNKRGIMSPGGGTPITNGKKK